jgi:hypothetical protein
VLLAPETIDDFNKICPFMNASAPVCCSDDQVAIMLHNFNTIDSVFGTDSPMCAVDMKKMWCEYTCNPRKTDFVLGTGYKQIPMDDGQLQNFTKVSFAIDEGTSCTLF